MSSNIIINKEIEEYINNHSLKLNSVQKEIILYNEGLGKIKRMQIAVSQCHFLHLIIKISKIKKILEIGTFTGLSTLSMSLALPKDGRLIALDKNQETNKIALNFFKKAKQDSKIQTIIRPAIESLKIFKEKKEKFDLVFIDADKVNYNEYFEQVLPKTRKGGLIISDNVMWSGKVIQKPDPKDFNTIALQDYNKKLKKDSRIKTLLLPFRDGLNLSWVL